MATRARRMRSWGLAVSADMGLPCVLAALYRATPRQRPASMPAKDPGKPFTSGQMLFGAGPFVVVATRAIEQAVLGWQQ